MTVNYSMLELSEFLIDRSIDPGSRDDIAMLFNESGDETVLYALYDVGAFPQCDEDILLGEECGEAIGTIMCRTKNFNIDYIQGLKSYKDYSALLAAFNVIESHNPEWVIKYNLLDLLKKNPEVKYKFKK